MRAGRLAEAEPLVRQRLTAAPDDRDAQALLGRVLLSLGDPNSEALDLLERAVAAGRTDVPTLLALGHARFAAASGQRDPSMKRILEVGAREAFGTAAAAARKALATNPADRLAKKSLADALRFKGDLLESANTSAQLLLSLQPGADAAFVNDVVAGLRDAVMRMPDAVRASDGVRVLRETVRQDLPRPAGRSRRVLAHLFIEVLRREEDWAALAAQGPALLTRYPGDRVMPYAVALALQHQAVDQSKALATQYRVRASEIYIAWMQADLAAGVPATINHQGYRGSYTLATALIDRGSGAAGRSIIEQLWAILPPGNARGWVTLSRGVEAKEAGDVAAAKRFYRVAVTADCPEPAALPTADDLAFLARAWSDLGLVHMGEAFQQGIATAAGAPAKRAAHDAFTKAIRYADRAVSMDPARGHDGHTFAIFARVNLARLEDRNGRRAAAVELVRAGLRAAATHPVARRRLDGTLTLRELLSRWR